jgi:hypothetical protein
MIVCKNPKILICLINEFGSAAYEEEKPRPFLSGIERSVLTVGPFVFNSVFEI